MSKRSEMGLRLAEKIMPPVRMIPRVLLTKDETCRQKRPYISQASASLFARKMLNIQYPYRCNVCGHWHLTSARIPPRPTDEPRTPQSPARAQ
jgi:hypothetical protein